MNSLADSIAQRIRAAREIRGLTQAELGDCLNLTGGAISKIEAGKSTVTVETLELLPKALDFPLEYFLGLNSHQSKITPGDETEILMLYRALSPEGRRLAKQTLLSWQESTKKNNSSNPTIRIIRTVNDDGDDLLREWVEKASPEEREGLANLLKEAFGLGDIV